MDERDANRTSKKMTMQKSHPATRTMRGGDPTPEQAASGKYPKERMQWHGLNIAIEHPEGTTREGVDETGRAWRTVFRYAYGEVIGSMGMDGDPVDVFVGQFHGAQEVYIVQQMKRKQWDVADEQKCMIDFASIDEAKAAYLEHYDDPRFFGGITAMPVGEFVKKVRGTKAGDTFIKSAVLFFKAHVGPYLRNGKMVNANGYQGKNARAVVGDGQLALFAKPPSRPAPPGQGWSIPRGVDPVANTPDMFGDDGARFAKPHEKLSDALKRGDLASAMNVLEPLSRDEAHEALLRAGFEITGSKTKKDLIAGVEAQILRAAKTKQDGYGVRRPEMAKAVLFVRR